MEVPEIVERLDHYDQRIHYSITRAIGLHKLWRTFQEAEGRETVAGQSAGRAMVICEKSLVDQTVLILVRLLDGRGRWPLFESNRISFPIVVALLNVPGVEDELASRARSWDGGWDADKHAADARGAVAKFRTLLAELRGEVPNREKLLRDFRDENLAHDLHFTEKRERPLYRHITEMIDALRALSDETALAIRGTTTAWEFFDVDVERAGKDLYRQLARGIEVEKDDRIRARE